jgi:uncharacterized protein with GYD domain
MPIFVTLVKYSPEGAKGISAERTKKADALLKAENGKLISAYGLLGRWDVLLICELPTEKAALKCAIQLSKLIGATTETMVGLPLAEFDQLAKEVK